MPSADAPAPPPFPTLYACTQLTSHDKSKPHPDIFDVKFYPYATQDDDQVFAIVTGGSTIVYRPRQDPEIPFEILRYFKADPSSGTSLNSLVWTKDPENGKPWVCVAGQTPKHITIFDIESGERVRKLRGHGRSINDLAISPICTSLLASAAEDKTIRLWNLEPSHHDQPCVALLSGEGHKDPVLAIHFHPNGKWLLSGGIDNAVCLWSIPDLSQLRRQINDDGSAKPGEPSIIYYPHFYTQELHSNYVDCLAFYGDLIISRASRDQKGNNQQNEILIWKIDGFDSGEDPPLRPPIPVPGERTRSSFPHQKGFRGFQRLLTLDMQHTDRFYHRFSLLHMPGMRPILAMGDQKAQYHFWDLQALEDGIGPPEAELRKSKGKKGKSKAGSSMDLDRLDDLRRSESVAEGTATSSDASGTTSVQRDNPLSDRFKPIKSHYKKLANVKLVNFEFATSQIAWSPDGTWMVSVGDGGVMCLFHRDRGVIQTGFKHQNG